ncbi:hypothetical protein V6N12_062350 [Hibiscus sabdariffa]|uniref:Uncharacterized protein n=1 Tax=Hibiscus sabdariffa TaxID=183260 RepID=A0ABR2F8J9_9ROSI
MSKKEIPRKVAVDSSLLSLPRCSKTLAWSSTMVVPRGASFVVFFSLSSSAPMLQHRVAHHPSSNATTSLPPQSL